MEKADKAHLKAMARQEKFNLRLTALNEAVRISNGSDAKKVVAEAKVLLAFLRGRK